MRRFPAPAAVALSVLLPVTLLGCKARTSGQVEAFQPERTTKGEKTTTTLTPMSSGREYPALGLIEENLRIGANARIEPQIGDLVRFTTDSVTIVIPTMYIDKVRGAFGDITGRYDMVLFAEVWENGAHDRSTPPLNRIVFLAVDQRLPSRLNFVDAIAYGPTFFKGHPIRIKFTLVLAQRRDKENADTGLKTLEQLSSLAQVGAPTSSAVSAAIGLARTVVKNIPDVEAFDFEMTLLPYRPSGVSERSRSVAKTLITKLSAIQSDNAKAVSDFIGRNEVATLADEYIGLQVEGLRVMSLFADAQSIAREFDESPEPVKGATASTVSTATAEQRKRAGLDQQFSNARTAINDEIESLKQRVDMSLRAEMDGLKLPAGSVLDANTTATLKSHLDKTRRYLLENTFKNVRAGAIELARASDTAAVSQACTMLVGCQDFRKLVADAARDTATEDGSEKRMAKFLEEAKCRPWLRYTTYALVETRRYKYGSTESTIFDAKDMDLANPLHQLRPGRPDGEQPNWMTVEVVPGLIALDDKVMEEASRAAGELQQSMGYTPSRTLLLDPKKTIEQVNAVESSILQGIARVRGEQLALRLAKEARAAGKSARSPFEIGTGMFASDFDKVIRKMVEGVGAQEKNALKAALEAIRDDIRQQFFDRFTG
jgi:hypothetical protein